MLPDLGRDKGEVNADSLYAEGPSPPLDRLIVLYIATNKPDEVKKWRAERAKYPMPKEMAPMPREVK